MLKKLIFKYCLITALLSKPSHSICRASEGFSPNIFIEHFRPPCVLRAQMLISFLIHLRVQLGIVRARLLSM
jgi:hypothetical protein